jgi:type VI secretion system protein ImpI
VKEATSMRALKVQIADSAANARRELVFTKSPVNIGRNELNELHLQEPFVSYWHGLVRFEGESIQYVDLGSTNGTLAEGRRLAKGEPIDVKEGQDLVIGSLTLRFQLAEALAQAPARRGQTLFGERAALLGGGEGPAVAPPAPAPAPTPAQRPTSQQLFREYSDYRKAYLAFHQNIAARLKSVTGAERQEELTRLVGRFPALSQEQPFQALLAELGLVDLKAPTWIREAPARTEGAPATPAPVERPAPPDSGPDRLAELLREFVTAYGAAEPAGGPEAVLGRLAEVLEAFAKGFLELKRGQAQLGEELSVRTFSESSGLQAASSPKELLGYLLSARDEAGRLFELTRAFTDVMVHQVALVNGMRAGVKALLARLSPERLSAEADRDGVRLGGMALPGGVWPLRSLARWARYQAEHHLLNDEEHEMSATVFGRDFARAYMTIARGRAEGER